MKREHLITGALLDGRVIKDCRLSRSEFLTGPLLYPQSSKRNTSMLILKKPKTESSIRRVFIPATVAHQLKAWKREQERAKEALGG